MKFKTILSRSAMGLGAFLILTQLVPYGHNHSNPPVLKEPAWDSAQTRLLVRQSCYDCHSNETRWPWYSQVAPVSWLIQRDVMKGRRFLNFSEWDRAQRHAHQASAIVQEGEMPPWFYLPMHAEARLTPEEKAALVQGLERSLGGDR